MRSLLGFVGFVLVLVVVLAAFLVPPVVGPVVASAVRAASPFGQQAIDVQVDVDAIGLIRGFVREIHVSGTGLEAEGVTIESVDVTVQTVGIGDHAFAQTIGGLRGVAVPTEDGAIISVERIKLSGSSTALIAEATMRREAAIAFIQHEFDASGVAISDLTLTDGGVAFVIVGQRVDVPLGVQDGALVIPDLLGGGPLELLAPPADSPWRLTGASVHVGGLEIEARVDASRMLEGAPASG